MGDPCFLPTAIKVLRLRNHKHDNQEYCHNHRMFKTKQKKKTQRYQDAFRDSLLNLYVLAKRVTHETCNLNMFIFKIIFMIMLYIKNIF